jgi:hypothetical protein
VPKGKQHAAKAFSPFAMLDDLPPEININTSTSVGYGNQIELLWHKDL